MWIIKNFLIILTIMASVAYARAEVPPCSEFPPIPEGYQAAKVSLPPKLQGKEAKIEIYFEAEVEKDACNTWYILGRLIAHQRTCSGASAGRAYEFNGRPMMTLVGCNRWDGGPPDLVPSIVRSEVFVFDADDVRAIYFSKKIRLKVRLWKTNRELPVTLILEGNDMEQRK